MKLKQNLSTNRKQKVGQINQRREQRVPSDDNINFPPLNQRNKHRSTWSDHFKESTSEGNQNASFRSNDLFSPKELMSFFKELVQSIQRCRSKFEQLEVVGDLVLRYLNEDGRP